MSFLQLLETSPGFYVSLSVVVGLMVGSFLNVVIYRLPKILERDWQAQCAALTGASVAPLPTYNLLIPRSACPTCSQPIPAWHNIPVFSYLLLRGRCAHCGAAFSKRYPIVEALTGFLTGYVAWHFGFGVAAGLAILFCWALLALTFIDLDTQLLPDNITLPLLWLGLLANVYATFTDLKSAVIGAIAGYLALWLVYWAFKLLTRKEGMGYGDFKLLAAIGAWLGWQMLPLVILLSSLVGAVVGVSLIIFARHGKDIPIPFGPYLAGGGLIALLWGREMTQAYLAYF